MSAVSGLTAGLYRGPASTRQCSVPSDPAHDRKTKWGRAMKALSRKARDNPAPHPTVEVTWLVWYTPEYIYAACEWYKLHKRCTYRQCCVVARNGICRARCSQSPPDQQKIIKLTTRERVRRVPGPTKCTTPKRKCLFHRAAIHRISGCGRRDRNALQVYICG